MIKVGYEVGTGKEVAIKNSHIIVTGLTQEAGKTTTLEALIKRSKKKAIVFKTKVGEKSFLAGTMIPPYFKEQSDWQFIQGLIEATIKEKVGTSARSKIIQLSKQTDGNSLIGFKKRVDERLLEKIGVSEKDILINLQAYLELVLPKLQSINFSKTLELSDGMNIIDLERFSRDPEVQSLIIKSILEEVLHNHKNVVVVIPEAWKFIPQSMGNPCKQSMMSFIKQGATNENFIWIDSQDMSDVDKSPLKQISTWILGFQSEINEVKHTIDQIPLSKNLKPKPEDIQTLGKGMFYVATRESTKKVYVQPFWLDDERAKKVAMGELKIEELDAPEAAVPFAVATKKETVVSEKPTIDFSETTKRFNKELNEIRTDFFNKIEGIQEQFGKVYSDIFEIKNQPKQELDEETIISKVLQKIPIAPVNNQSPSSPIDKEGLIREILARVPSGGNVVYEVSPLEKIKKDFLEEAKNKILSDINTLNADERKALKYMESAGRGIKAGELIQKCFLLKDGRSSRAKASNTFKKLSEIDTIRKDKGGTNFPELKSKISKLLEVHEAKQEEIEQVYNHILMEMLQ
jgi:hypothetical protein